MEALREAWPLLPPDTACGPVTAAFVSHLPDLADRLSPRRPSAVGTPRR
ncbi:hypothetical protein PUR61_23915 [Streptomyces sp. BE20]|nr:MULTISPECIES: hypothetical protein [unclassified Streptomyces]MED7950962.1 hypothetical protein [Streptomyces sp. BE303]MEE1825204.1 hypothetical protein [Streptomyces sp. BE20]